MGRRKTRKLQIEILLIAVLMGGALGGSSLHAADQGCDCCKVARSCQRAPLAFGARLCCLLYCPQSGEHVQPNCFQLSQLAFLTVQQSERFFGLIASAGARRSEHAQALNSRPQYILHLALLI